MLPRERSQHHQGPLTPSTSFIIPEEGIRAADTNSMYHQIPRQHLLCNQKFQARLWCWCWPAQSIDIQTIEKSSHEFLFPQFTSELSLHSFNCIFVVTAMQYSALGFLSVVFSLPGVLMHVFECNHAVMFLNWIACKAKFFSCTLVQLTIINQHQYKD